MPTNIIKLNGQVFTLSNSSKPAITRQANNISEWQDRQADKSTTFKIPKTKENILAFERAQDISSTTRLPYGFFRAEYPQGGINIGLAKLMRSLPDGYEFNVFGGLLNFWKLLEIEENGERRDLTLNDLDLSDYDHNWNKTEVAIGLTKTDGYCYALTDYGTFPTDNNTVFFDNFRPLIYEITILRAIFDAQGWTFSGGIFDTEEFQRCVLPWSSEEWSNGARYASTYGINIEQPLGTLNLNGSVPATGAPAKTIVTFPWSTFTATTRIQAEVTGNITLQNYSLVPNVGAALQFIINGVVQPQLTTISGDGSYSVSESIILQAGDTLELALVFGQPAGTDLAYTYNTDYLQGSIVTDELIARIEYNTEVNLEALLPDLTQKEFVKAICQKYMLTTHTNSELQDIFFFTWNELTGNIGNALDWSHKVDYANTEGYKKLEYKYGSYGQVNNLKWLDSEDVTGNYNGSININDDSLQASVDLVELDYSASDETNSSFGVINFSFNVAQIKRFEANEPPVGLQEYIDVEPRNVAVEFFDSPTFIIDTGNFGDGTLNVLAGSKLRSYFILGTYSMNFNAFKQRHFNTLEESTLNAIKVPTFDIKLNEIEVSSYNPFIPIYIGAPINQYHYFNLLSNFIGEEQLTECLFIRL